MTDWDNLIEWFEDNEDADDLEDIDYLMKKVNNRKLMKKKKQKELRKALEKAFGQPIYYRYVRVTYKDFLKYKQTKSKFGKDGKVYLFRKKRFRK